MDKMWAECKSSYLMLELTSKYPPWFAECGKFIPNNLLGPDWADQCVGSIDFEVVKDWT